MTFQSPWRCAFFGLIPEVRRRLIIARYVGPVTGPGHTTRFGAGATDLGYTALTNHGYTIAVFGDTFVDHVGGQHWRSPVGLRQHNPDIENGIVWDNAIGGARAKQMLDYEHVGTFERSDGPDGFTNIPNDILHLPDGRYIMTTFAVSSWEPRSAGNSWTTHHCRMWTSTETHAEDWERTVNLETGQTNVDFPSRGNWAHFQNNTMLLYPGEPWVYIYGTDEGRWEDGGIYLMRVDWRHMWELSRYEFFGQDSGGTWSWRVDAGGAASPVVLPTRPGDWIGELNAQVIDGAVVLSYLDGPRWAVTRTAPRPEGRWSQPRVQVTMRDQPCLYAPSIHPYSSLGRAQMLLSQWTRGADGFYGVHQWEVALEDPPQDHYFAGHRGPLAPPLRGLPEAEQLAILRDNSGAALSIDA